MAQGTHRVVVVGALALAGCPKKAPEPEAPPQGWHREEGWTRDCYYPPDFSKLEKYERREAWNSVRDELLAQWRGERGDGVSFPSEVIDEVETILLGTPGKIEALAARNLELCAATAATGDTGEWGSWFEGLPDRLNAGECLRPFTYTMFDYLDIFNGWQRSIPLCAGDRVVIRASSKDRYKVRDDGPWIDAAGDPDRPTAGDTDYPCDLEGCLEGMFIARFVTESGVETILPVGLEMVFEAPENGELSYRINDTTFYDNKWFKHGGIEDHTSIEISPAR